MAGAAPTGVPHSLYATGDAPWDSATLAWRSVGSGRAKIVACSIHEGATPGTFAELWGRAAREMRAAGVSVVDIPVTVQAPWFLRVGAQRVGPYLLRAFLPHVPRRNLVVLLAGRAGAGKDTAAAEVRPVLEERGFRVATLAFADALRDVALRMMRDVWAPAAMPDWFTDRGRKEMPVHELAGSPPVRLAGRILTPRWLLQWLGTDVMRANVSDSVWVDALVARTAAAAATEGGAAEGDGPLALFVTDLRFPNEASEETARRLAEAVDGEVVRLRLVDPAAPPLPPDAHVSERGIASLPVHAEVVNDKSKGRAALRDAVLHAHAAYCE